MSDKPMTTAEADDYRSAAYRHARKALTSIADGMRMLRPIELAVARATDTSAYEDLSHAYEFVASALRRL